MGRPQEFFGAEMWSENATSAHHPPVFVLEERHADGTRWIELHRYPTKDEAGAALDAVIADGAIALGSASNGFRRDMSGPNGRD
jgi:hypothetical protein